MVLFNAALKNEALAFETASTNTKKSYCVKCLMGSFYTESSDGHGFGWMVCKNNSIFPSDSPTPEVVPL